MIADWLQEPSPGHRFACSLSMKKTLLVVVCFLLLMSLGIVEYLFIEKFDLLLPRMAHAFFFLFELLTFLVFTFAIYPEKYNLILPFAISQAIRVIVLSALLIYYIVTNFSDDRSSVWMTVGHLFFVVIVHIWLAQVVFRTYQTFKNRGSSVYSAPPDVLSTGHHVIVLEQPIEQAMYGKRM